MSKISTQVMAAVALVYAARVLMSATALKLYILALSLWGIARLVWVSKVLENFFAIEKSGVASVGNFMLSAVEHAHIAVQLALVVAIIAAVSLLLDFTRTSSGGRSFAA